MADTVKTTDTLNVGLTYIESDTAKEKTVYLKLPNPKNTLNEQTIKTAVNGLISPAILMTPDGQPFNSATAITTAYREEQETIDLDLGLN